MKRPTIKKVMHCVFFFGTYDFAWIPESDIKPYEEFKKALTTSKKSVKKAVDEIEAYIAGGCKQTTAQIIATKAPPSANNSMAVPEEDDDDAEFDALFSDKPVSASKKKKRNISADSDEATASKKKKKSENNHDNNDDERESSPLLSNHTNNRKSAAASSFLDRPMLDRPASPSTSMLDMTSTSKTLKEKDIQPSKANFGFLGLGSMGTGIVKNLLNSGHSVTVWNRQAEKCQDFMKAGAREAMTPGDVIAESDITFSCVSDPQAAKDLVFGNCGVLSEINTMKGKQT